MVLCDSSLSLGFLSQCDDFIFPSADQISDKNSD